MSVSADTRRWCLHDIGPDEVHAAPDFETAQKWANWANARFNKHAEFTRFVVSPWSWTAERHAETLAKSIEEWTLPESREDSDDFLQQLAGRARHLRDQGEIKTPELLERAQRALAAVQGWREWDWPESFCRRTADLIAENAERAAATKEPVA